MEQGVTTATQAVIPSAPNGPAAGLAVPRKIGSSLEATPELIQMLLQLRIGLSQSVLYTAETAQFGRARDATYASLRIVLDVLGTIKLSFARSDVLINGTRINLAARMKTTVEAIEKTLSSAGTSSLIFDKALSVDEFGPFMQMLARKQLPTGDSLQVNSTLRELGMPNIQVDELRYIALGREQKVVTTDQPGLANHAVAQQAITDLVDATLDSIDSIQDTEARSQLRSEFADQLIEKDESMLTSLLVTSLQRVRLSSNPELQRATAIPQRDLALLREAIEAARLIRSEGLSMAPLGHLRALIEMVSEPYKTRAEDLLSTLKLDANDTEFLPEWLRGAMDGLQAESAPERLNAVLHLSPAALLDSNVFLTIIDILDELSVSGQDAEAEQLMAHLAGSLRSPTKKERCLAVERMGALLKRSIEQCSKAVKLLEDALLETCTHETCDEVMKLLLEHLIQRSEHHYHLGNYQRAIEHLEWIVSLEESSRLAMKDDGANLARIKRDEWSHSEFAMNLLSDMQGSDEKAQAAHTMAQKLGSGLAHGALDALKKEENPDRIELLARFLRTQGKEGPRKLGEALDAEGNPERAVRLFRATRLASDTSAGWAAIQSALHHTTPEVRSEALHCVLSKPPVEAAPAIATALRTDNDPERRKIWLMALSSIKDPAAHAVVLELIDGAVETPQENEADLLQLLPAAAMPGQYAAVAVITKLLRPRSRSIAGGGEPSREVVIAAIKALGLFYQDANAAETLERLRQSKDPEISRVALVALRGIIAAEQQREPSGFHSGSHPAASGSNANNASISGTSAAVGGRQSGTRGIRKGFEALAMPNLDDVFKVGRVVGAATSAQMQAIHPDSEPSMRPTLEGDLANLNLAHAVRMSAGRDGFMVVRSPEGDGRVYIRKRKVVGAQFGELQNLQALSKMEAQKQGQFAFYAADFTARETMALEADTLMEEIRKHRDRSDSDMYQD